MAVDIKLKRSNVPGKVPTTSSLELGELAINTYDGKAYIKKQVGNVESIVELGTASGSVVSASYATNAGNAQTASYSFNSVSASYAVTAAYALNAGQGGISAIYIADEGALQGTASYFDFSGDGVVATVNSGTASIVITGGGSGGVGKSVLFTQASPTNTWTFNHNLGSQYVTYNVYDGSGNAIIPTNVAATNANTLTISFTVPTSGYAVATVGGGLPAISASFEGYVLSVSGSAATWTPTSSLGPTTSSYALNALSASYAANSTSASYANNATSASYANNATSASYANNATSASYTLNATSASYANNATSASYALNATSASYANNATSASYANNSTSASYANNATSASYASASTSASYASTATSASYASTSTSASYALNSTSASYSLSSTSASYASASTSASYALRSVSASYTETASYVDGVVYISGSQTIVGEKTFGTNTFFNQFAVLQGSGSDNFSLAFKQASSINYYGNNHTSIAAFSNNQLYFDFNQGGLSYKRFKFDVSDLSTGNERTFKFPDKTGTLLINDITTGSVATASYASGSTSASYASASTSASYASSSTSASYAVFATNASYASASVSASYASASTSASYASASTSASYADNSTSSSYALFATSASYASASTSASYALNTTSASYALTSTSASYAIASTSASYAINATSASYSNNSTSASYANNATSASYSNNSTSASYSNNATSASYSNNATSASYANNSTSASYAAQATTASFASTIANGLNITASSVYINNNLTVNGTASFNYVSTVTGSAIIIGQEYIILNTQLPAARFAGLQIYDSGSNSTASLVWDSQTDHFVYSKSSGSVYSGGMFIAGPKNTGSLGQEQTLTQWRVPVAQGDDHIMDSQIYSSGSITQITGSLTVTSGVTGSLQGTASWANNAISASYALNATNASTASFISAVKDGMAAYFQPATNDGYNFIKFDSKINGGSDLAFILFQDDSEQTSGSLSNEDVRFTMGVFNDFSGTVHSDELWMQGGARLVYNVGSWDSEMNSIIGTPSVKAAGDLYSWNKNNSPVMIMNIDGNLGIGTTSPTSKLDVVGSGLFSGTVTATDGLRSNRTQDALSGLFLRSTIDGSTITNNGIILGKAATANNAASIVYTHSSDGSTSNRLGFGFWASDNLLNLTATGNVGIGTTSPDYKLDVVGAGKFTTGLTVSGNGGAINAASRLNIDFASGNSRLYSLGANSSTKGGFEFHTNSSDGSLDVIALKISSDGNVGIGSSSPATKLDVSGTATISSDVIANRFYRSGFAIPTSAVAVFNNTNYNGPGWNTASLVTGNGATGVMMGGDAGLYSYGWIQGVQTDNGATKGLYLNPLGGGVTIGGAATFNSSITTTDLRFLDVAYITADSDDSGTSPIVFRNGATGELMRITSGGSVGIGTTSPTNTLVVNGSQRSYNGSSYEVIKHGTFTLNDGTAGNFNHFITIGTTNVYATSVELTLSEENTGHSVIKYTIVTNYDDLNSTTKRIILPLYSTNPRFENSGGSYGGAVHELQMWSDGSGTMYLRLVVKTTGNSATPNWYWTAKLKNCDITATPNSTGTDNTTYSIYRHTQITQRNSNVGIGTTSPASKLDVVGGDGIRTSTDQSTSAFIVLAGTSTEGRITVSSYGSYQPMTLYTGGSERLRITSGGNVGINTTSPKQRLDIDGVFGVGSKSFTCTNSYATGLTINLSSHTGVYVKVTLHGDLSGHSAIGYMGEYFIQNGDGGYSEPGMIIREVNNTSNATTLFSAQIVDPASSGTRNFELQFKQDSVTSSVGTTLIYQIQGTYNSIS